MGFARRLHIYDLQQLNRFTYVRNNPVKFVDPDGHQITMRILIAGTGDATAASPILDDLWTGSSDKPIQRFFIDINGDRSNIEGNSFVVSAGGTPIGGNDEPPASDETPNPDYDETTDNAVIYDPYYDDVEYGNPWKYKKVQTKYGYTFVNSNQMANHERKIKIFEEKRASVGLTKSEQTQLWNLKNFGKWKTHRKKWNSSPGGKRSNGKSDAKYQTSHNEDITQYHKDYHIKNVYEVSEKSKRHWIKRKTKKNSMDHID